jgi:hypothetical protein
MTASMLRRALGVLWLADVLVKLSLPFGDRPHDQWYDQVMTAEAGPLGLHQALAWEAGVFADHPLLWWLPAAVELGIGGWLVIRPGSRRALAVSIGWAVIVWLAGEGMGGLLTGVSSILGGYPGAALLYAAAAVILFPRRTPRPEAATAAEAGITGQWSRTVWLALWIGAAFFTATPQTGENGLQFMLSVNQAEGAGPLRSMDTGVLGWLTVGNTNMLGFAAAAVCLAAGFAVFLGAWPRLSLILAMLTALAGWVVFQNFAGIYTGSATDVGTGPVLILLACAFWPARRARRPDEAAAGAAETAPPVPASPGGTQTPAGR